MTSPSHSFWDDVGARAEFDFSKVNLLVVDDSALLRDTVRATFGNHVKSVHETTGVERAADVLARDGGDISCVICDWTITPIGGLELLRMIRCRTLPGAPARLPFVIVTSRPDAEAVKAAMELDVNGFAVMPISVGRLIRAVTGALSRSWALQRPGHYASVAGIAPPAAAPLREARPDTQAVRRLHDHSRPPTGRPFARRSAVTGMSTGLRNVRMCILEDVSPGAVLARDLRDREGHVLAPSGTELNSGILQRLKNVGYALSDSYYVWVGER